MIPSAGLRVLVLDTYYTRFLRAHYAARPELREAPFEQQHVQLMARSFGTSDAYSHNLRLLGHEAAEVVVNCVPSQARWAVEHGQRSTAAFLEPLLARGGRPAARLTGTLHRITLAQVAALRRTSSTSRTCAFTRRARSESWQAHSRLVVGQIASSAPSLTHLRAFDLITTSFPHFVPRFRRAGVAVGVPPDRFRRAGAGATAQPAQPPRADVVFVGGLDPRVHGEGVRLSGAGRRGAGCRRRDLRLRRLAARRRRHRCAIAIAARRGASTCTASSQAHGSHSIGTSPRPRDTRTTCGCTRRRGLVTALLTDAGRNLGELFEPGVEVATYDDRTGLWRLLAACSQMSDDAPLSPRQARRRRSAATPTRAGWLSSPRSSRSGCRRRGVGHLFRPT